MDNLDNFDTMMDAMVELAEEMRTAPPPPAPALPSLASVLADSSSLPREALFLGLAEDGLPVLIGDEKSGKTKLLQTIAQAADTLHEPSDLQYVVITSHPDEWKAFHGSQNNAGIYITEDDNATELIQSLANWAHNNKGEQQSILLLMDNLETISKLGPQVEQNLRWLLLRGPSRHVWPIVTLNSDRAKDMIAWLEFFRSRLFGHIENNENSALITGDSKFDLNSLKAGTQFAIREGNELLKFVAPAIDETSER